MAEYRIVKWWPDSPTAKQSVGEHNLYTDLELANEVKTELEKDMPHRRFAVEVIEPKSKK